jgi:hypothetical protein
LDFYKNKAQLIVNNNSNEGKFVYEIEFEFKRENERIWKVNKFERRSRPRKQIGVGQEEKWPEEKMMKIFKWFRLYELKRLAKLNQLWIYQLIQHKLIGTIFYFISKINHIIIFQIKFTTHFR